MAKEIKEYGIPFEEIKEVTYKDQNKNALFIITRHPYNGEHYLYKITNNKAKKIETNKNPNLFKAITKLQKQWLENINLQEEEIQDV